MKGQKEEKMSKIYSNKQIGSGLSKRETRYQSNNKNKKCPEVNRIAQPANNHNPNVDRHNAISLSSQLTKKSKESGRNLKEQQEQPFHQDSSQSQKGLMINRKNFNTNDYTQANDQKTLNRKLKQPVKNFQNIEELRKFLSNQIYSKVSQKNDSLIEKYSRWRMKQDKYDKINSFQSAEALIANHELKSQQSQIEVVKNMLPSIQKSSRNMNDAISYHKYHSIIVSQSKNSILMSNEPMIQQRSMLSSTQTQENIQSINEAYLNKQHFEDSDFQNIVFNIRTKKKHLKNQKSHASQNTSQLGNKESIDISQDNIPHSQQIKSAQRKQNTLPSIGSASTVRQYGTTNPEGNKRKNELQNQNSLTNKDPIEKKHLMTREDFFANKKVRKLNTGLNLELELQDKRIVNKLILIQKHNEGLIDLPQISQNNFKSNKYRQSSALSPKHDILRVQTQLQNSENKATLKGWEDETSPTNKQRKIQTQRPLKQVELKPALEKKTLKPNRNSNLQSSQSLDNVMNQNQVTSRSKNKAEKIQKKMQTNFDLGKQLTQLGNEGEPKDIINKDSKEHKKLNLDLNTNSKIQAKLTQNLYSGRQQENSSTNKSMSQRFKKLMKFDTNQDFEHIEYELLIIDKLMQQRNNIQSKRLASQRTIADRNEDQEKLGLGQSENTKLGKKGGVVFNLSRNETNLIYNE
eukprot:403348657